jgi:hypothetical protein
MKDQTAWERACELNGLLKAADALVEDARTDLSAHSGLISVLSVALRLSDQVLSDAEWAEGLQEPAAATVVTGK